jgi:hypothetical protein
MILTKKPWIFDPNGDRDRDDITEEYKNKEGNDNTDRRRSLCEGCSLFGTKQCTTDAKETFINNDFLLSMAGQRFVESSSLFPIS